MVEKPIYSTWIRASKIFIFWSASIAILATALLGYLYKPLVYLGLLSIPFFYIAIIVSLTAYKFSSKGGDFQNKIHQIVISNCPLIKNVIDIGCGNGNLIIKYAKKYPNGKYVGIDYWGDKWEYSQDQCIKNAKIEKLENIIFQKASASKLPFENEMFSNVISCLTFHEVQDVEDKIESIFEAIRVLKPNGKFAFFDLFNDPKYYKGMQNILAEMGRHGVQNIKYQAIQEIVELPFPLNDKKSLKYGVIISGEK